MNIILITYTTVYREGGDDFERAAERLTSEKSESFPGLRVVCRSTDSKSEFLQVIERVKEEKELIQEFHFIGHSGVYGIMFGTRSWPEQFSPYEWKQQTWPLAADAKMYFHACRTARWFAPYLAQHFKVPVCGYWWYTTISGSSKKFRRQKNGSSYIISCPGRKSHGLLGSLAKHSGFVNVYSMTEFKPEDVPIDRSYDLVSELYEETFEDLRVRKDEWRWLNSVIDFSTKPAVLDIGCGNGAFLRQSAPGLGKGCGVDASPAMLEIASKKAAAAGLTNLLFARVEEPKLEFESDTFDYVLSILSFRYLDWDPMVSEILRVLKPGGRLVILDMVASPVKLFEWPQFMISKVRHYVQRIKNPRYFEALSKLVASSQWKQMLKYNPIRAEHEYRWYLESRFPDGKYGCINIGWNSRIVTFVSAPIYFKTVEKLSFP